MQVVATSAIFHSIRSCADDTVAPEDDDGAGLEAISAALCQDQLSAEVSALGELPPDHDYWLQVVE